MSEPETEEAEHEVPVESEEQSTEESESEEEDAEAFVEEETEELKEFYRSKSGDELSKLLDSSEDIAVYCYISEAICYNCKKSGMRLSAAWVLCL